MEQKVIKYETWQKLYGFKEPEEKLRIYYTPEAYAKSIKLVNSHPLEIGWNMVVKPYKDGYKVYDIFVYPQKVSPAYVSVDLGNYGLWKSSLKDDTEANLNGQAHSHVNMSTYPSFVDNGQQQGEIKTKKHGFYLFQIWNKRGEINSFFYDIDNGLFYDNDNITITVEHVDDFIENSYNMLSTERNYNFEAGEDF